MTSRIVMTIGPNAAAARIHDRVPVMLPHNKCESEKRWGYRARDRLRTLLRGADVTFCPD